MKKFLAVIAFVLTTLVASPAQAYNNSSDDSPGYVTYLEFQTAGRGTMSETERSWGVVGLGEVVYQANGGKQIIKSYPYAWNWYCTGSTAQVSYQRNAAGQYMSSYITLIIFTPDPLSKVTCER